AKMKSSNGASVGNETQLSVANRHMELLYKSAIEKLNTVLQPDFGPNAIQSSAELDVSPEATAGRIVSLSTAFFGAFREQNPELGDEEALNQFMSTIGSGIEQGFAEAREILDGLQVLNGDIATNIDTTYDLVQQGLQNFKDSISTGPVDV
ncbi:DUF5610 domain-containing protein, partial [Pseudomonadota bacterium]